MWYNAAWRRTTHRLGTVWIEAIMASACINDIASFRRTLIETAAWCTSRDSQGIGFSGFQGGDLRTPALRPPHGLETPTELARPRFPDVSNYPGRTPEWYAEQRRRWYEQRDARLEQGRLEQPRIIAERRTIAQTVAAGRARLLRDARHYPPSLDVRHLDGRLLLFVPDETLSDGAAAIGSGGFFDAENVPPWDTWVEYVGSYLISWVPGRIVGLVDHGIDANPESCILWATDLDAAFTRQLSGEELLF
jgi:hypothetical protein